MGGAPADVGRMKAEARSRGVGERSVFSGQRPPSELPPFLALADVLASPRAKGQNTPFKIFTYLASGTAARGHPHPHAHAAARRHDRVPRRADPEGLAVGIRAALDRPEDAAARAGAGRDLIEREYSVERYREKIARAYATVERLGRAREPTRPQHRAPDPARTEPKRRACDLPRAEASKRSLEQLARGRRDDVLPSLRCVMTP